MVCCCCSCWWCCCCLAMKPQNQFFIFSQIYKKYKSFKTESDDHVIIIIFRPILKFWTEVVKTSSQKGVVRFSPKWCFLEKFRISDFIPDYPRFLKVIKPGAHFSGIKRAHFCTFSLILSPKNTHTCFRQKYLYPTLGIIRRFCVKTANYRQKMRKKR